MKTVPSADIPKWSLPCIKLPPPALSPTIILPLTCNSWWGVVFIPNLLPSKVKFISPWIELAPVDVTTLLSEPADSKFVILAAVKFVKPEPSPIKLEPDTSPASVTLNISVPPVSSVSFFILNLAVVLLASLSILIWKSSCADNWAAPLNWMSGVVPTLSALLNFITSKLLPAFLIAIFPTTDNLSPGALVPIPTLLFESTTKVFVPAPASTIKGVAVPVLS